MQCNIDFTCATANHVNFLPCIEIRGYKKYNMNSNQRHKIIMNVNSKTIL